MLLVAGVVAGTIAAAPARAEHSPYTFGAGVRLGHDDNVFRAPAGQELASRSTTWRAFAGVDETISRQRLRAHLELRRTDYAAAGQLDHDGYTWRAAWDGATAGAWSWSLTADGRRALTSYDAVVEPTRRVPDLETLRRFGAVVQHGLRAQWVARAGLNHRRIGHSSAAFASDELRVDGLEAGVLHNPGGVLTPSLGVRLARGRYPQARLGADGSFVADRYERRDIDLGARWVPSGASEISARLSATREDRSVAEERSFRGTTGRLSWQWQPAGKTRLTTTVLRDTGSEATFLNLPGELPGSSDSSRTITALLARVDYQLTAKTSFALSWWQARRDHAAGALTAEPARERSHVAALMARYEPTRNSVVACELARSRRASSGGISSPYHARTTACSAQLAFD
jgi:hypothetical protein